MLFLSAYTQLRAHRMLCFGFITLLYWSTSVPAASNPKIDPNLSKILSSLYDNQHAPLLSIYSTSNILSWTNPPKNTPIKFPIIAKHEPITLDLERLYKEETQDDKAAATFLNLASPSKALSKNDYIKNAKSRVEKLMEQYQTMLKSPSPSLIRAFVKACKEIADEINSRKTLDPMGALIILTALKKQQANNSEMQKKLLATMPPLPQAFENHRTLAEAYLTTHKNLFSPQQNKSTFVSSVIQRLQRWRFFYFTTYHHLQMEYNAMLQKQLSLIHQASNPVDAIFNELQNRELRKTLLHLMNTYKYNKDQNFPLIPIESQVQQYELKEKQAEQEGLPTLATLVNPQAFLNPTTMPQLYRALRNADEPTKMSIKINDFFNLWLNTAKKYQSATFEELQPIQIEWASIESLMKNCLRTASGADLQLGIMHSQKISGRKKISTIDDFDTKAVQKIHDTINRRTYQTQRYRILLKTVTQFFEVISNKKTIPKALAAIQNTITEISTNEAIISYTNFNLYLKRHKPEITLNTANAKTEEQRQARYYGESEDSLFDPLFNEIGAPATVGESMPPGKILEHFFNLYKNQFQTLLTELNTTKAQIEIALKATSS